MKATEVMQELVGKTYPEVVAALSFDSHDGDCCGSSDCDVLDCLRGRDDLDSAILVKAIELDYNEDCHSGERIVVNFVFKIGEEEGLILGYDLNASSSSGWCYGAWATLYYEGKEIATASW